MRRLVILALFIPLFIAGNDAGSIEVSAEFIPPIQKIEKAESVGNTSRKGEEPSKLLVMIRNASHEKKAGKSRKILKKAIEMVRNGANVNEKDIAGRTPLHWAVIGSAEAVKQDHIVDYIMLIESLLLNGADVNSEDMFENPPMYYQELSHNEIVKQVLLEYGSEGGYAYDISQQYAVLMNDISNALDAGDLAALDTQIHGDLPIGTLLQIRLKTKIGSNLSNAGDILEAVIIEPVVVEDRVVIPTGTIMEGTVMQAAQAKNEETRAELVLDIDNLVHHSGARTRLTTQVVKVDNARESVVAGCIVGIPYPHSKTSRISWGTKLVGIAWPQFSKAVDIGMAAFKKTFNREITYNPGTDITLKVLIPEHLEQDYTDTGWSRIAITDGLRDLVLSQPLRTTTRKNVESDIVNMMFIGTEREVQETFEDAGWTTADDLGMKSGLRSFATILQNRGYETAPVSLLQLEGRAPDLVFQKQNNTFFKRHHLRIWKRPDLYKGKDVWIAAGTNDIGIGILKKGTQWIHRIDPMIDKERHKVAVDLMFTGIPSGLSLIDRPDAPRKAMNATDDHLITDGKMMVIEW